MKFKSKFFLFLSCIMLLMLLGFKYEDQDFPLDQDGYPLENILLINRKKYRLDDDLHIKLSEENHIVLPKILAAGQWVLEETEGARLLEEVHYLPDDNMDYPLRGPSPFLQDFTIKLEEGQDLVFNYYRIQGLIGPEKEEPIYSLRIKNKSPN